VTVSSYFFCGIGGSGMSALAAILRLQGYAVAGSDRGYDQGKSPEKFAHLKSLGIDLCPQDGSGVKPGDILVVSTAIEESIPDVQAARRLGLKVMKRAEILAWLFESRKSVAIGGTSGKTTVTGMAGWAFSACGYDPLIVNGGVMLNFNDNIHAGQGGWIVAETDESDGSIALFTPDIAVLNNVTLDHKPVAELRGLFADFLRKARIGAVVNLDDPEAAVLLSHAANGIGFGIDHKNAVLNAYDLTFSTHETAFTVTYQGRSVPCALQVPGRHNVSNALASIGAALMAGIDLEKACAALAGFKGTQRRLETVGTKAGVTVIDDFAHNPDKIAASLATLRQSPGRLLIMFQPHGFAPMRMMRKEITQAFAEGMDIDDVLLMPEIFYAGGTTVKDISSGDLINDVRILGRKAEFMQTREDLRNYLLSHARDGDRIVIMGARDDTLTDFARALLNDIKL
jgi:UDP-N-acetylmuramate--alanine ligase